MFVGQDFWFGPRHGRVVAIKKTCPWRWLESSQARSDVCSCRSCTTIGGRINLGPYVEVRFHDGGCYIGPEQVLAVFTKEG